MLRTLLCGTLVFALYAQTKRPVAHTDYDSWNSIVTPKISNDGRYVIYGLFPQEGDGYAVIRELATRREIRLPAGQRPEPPPRDYSVEGPPVTPRGFTSAFTSDSAWVVFSTYPSKADLDKARGGTNIPPNLPKRGLTIVRLQSGESVHIDNVKSFQAPATASSHIAYLRENDDLVLRTLTSGAERTFPGTAEYRLTDDATTLVFLTKNEAAVLAVQSGEVKPLVSGEAKYGKLAASDGQDQFAFLKGSSLYYWTRAESAAMLLTDSVSPHGSLTFSSTGQRLFYGLPVPEPKPAAGNGAVFDLWHYADDFIQPMQQVRAKRERERSYLAVYLLEEKRSIPLAGERLATVTPSRDGLMAFGMDDRAYRRMVEYDSHYADIYVLDAEGKRSLVAKKASGTPSLSPDGRFLAMFDGRDWISYETSAGITRNLTAITGRAFYREDDDHPGRPPAYGGPQWTQDSKYILLPDRYDLWQFAADGSMSRNLTDGVGRISRLEFRILNLDNDPKAPGIDGTRPLLLRAENTISHETGYWRDSLEASEQPKKLLMGPMNYGTPIKAKNAPAMVLTAGNFQVFPDLHVADEAMNLERISDANPQQKNLAWGTSELIRYRNADGQELSAALFKPANFDPSKKYPMIVYLYEKLSNTINDFVDPAPSHRINASYYTSNGYVVLMPDIVYTIGYPGASALKCIVPATQKVLNMGFVDPARVGIQGHSWGGYQIAYMVTQTNLFKAAAPGALVANMISAYDGIRWGPGLPRQFQYEKTQSRIGGTPWQYPMRFIENSPIFLADRIETPILMLHNDADDAVPWYQGIEFFLALRRLGKEAYFFNYNGEPHGLHKRANQKDYTRRMQEFFDYYLKQTPKPDWMERGRSFLEKQPGSVSPATSDQY